MFFFINCSNFQKKVLPLHPGMGSNGLTRSIQNAFIYTKGYLQER